MTEKMSIRAVLAFVVIVVYTVSTAEACPWKWDHFEGHCYRLFKKNQNWFKAQDSCREEGAHLAQIDDSDENTWVQAQIKSDTWIDGSDLGEEDMFKWFSSGDKFRYTNWNAGEPNSSFNTTFKDEDCVAMKHKKELGKWNDTPCSIERHFICEKSTCKD